MHKTIANQHRLFEGWMKPKSRCLHASYASSVQALIGGQPLLINDVSEPITITYGYMYTFARNKQGLGTNNFLAWAGWSCVWAGIMLIIVAVFNGCDYINRFTRFSGELFGCLVAILFVQQFVQGAVGEFREQDTVGAIKYAPSHLPCLLCTAWELCLHPGCRLSVNELSIASQCYHLCAVSCMCEYFCLWQS